MLQLLRVAEDRWQPVLPHPLDGGQHQRERLLSAMEILVARHGCHPASGVAVGPTVAPFVNHGRWLLQCPFCPSTTLASRRDLRFFCVECMADGATWLPVEWAPDAGRVEELLGRRPDVHTRNWTPGEPVDQLAGENRSHPEVR